MDPPDRIDNVPRRFILELTERCNYRCIHCFVPHKLYGPTTEQAIIIANKVVKAGVPSISWTGGEPFIREDFFEIMEQISSGEVVHTVNTNGSFITRASARRAAQYFSLARVSVYGKPSTFFHNTGGVQRANYETSMNAIKLFLDAGLPVQVNIPAISPDVSDLEAITRDLEKRFGSALEEVVIIQPIKIGEKRNNTVRYPSEECVRVVTEQLKTGASFPVRFFVWKAGKHMVMKANTNIYAHPIFTNEDGCMLIGNILDESVEELWARFPPEFKKNHRDLTPDVTYLRVR